MGELGLVVNWFGNGEMSGPVETAFLKFGFSSVGSEFDPSFPELLANLSDDGRSNEGLQFHV